MGISLSVMARFSGHRAGSSWYRRLARLDVEFYGDRLSARVAEYEAIRDEHPVHNIQRGGWFAEALARPSHSRPELTYVPVDQFDGSDDGREFGEGHVIGRREDV